MRLQPVRDQKLIFNNTDGTTTESYVAFNDDLPAGTNWQYAATPAVAEKAYKSVTVQCLYNYNVNTVYFDGIQLFKESFGSSYAYDDDGNLISVVDLQNTITNYEYANNDLTKILENNKAKMKYEYDSYHNVIKATTQKKDTSGNTVDDIVYSFEYDAYGNNTLVRVGTGDTAITTSATYTSDYNRMATSTDDLANVTTYCYNENTNVLEWVQYPNDTDYTWTSYTYDSMYRLANARAIDTNLSSSITLTASYTYTNDLLAEIETASTTYSFAYGDFAQRSSIMVGDRTLASYTYTDDQNHYLEQLAYGNGDTINYEYDDEGRVTKEIFEDGSTVSYAYDNTGALATVTDSATGRKTTYYYDLTDRLVKYVDSGSGYEHGVSYTYDSLNNLQKLVETINGVKHETTYTYDYENRLTLTDYGNGITESVNYDSYGRLYFTQTKNGDESIILGLYQYSFDSPIGAQSTVLAGVQAFTPADYTLSAYYSHDGNGNITRYYMYGTYDMEWWSFLSEDNEDYTSRMGEVYYHYDASNQLIREDSMWQDKTFVWEYDNAGNITACKEYAYTDPYDEVTGTPTKVNTYTYGNASWGDLLTAYNGATRSYDAIGNLLSDGTWNYTWQNGRELSSMSNGSTTWSYTYDANGMRTSRSDGTTTYNYIYNGSQLVQMTVGNDTLYFTYGAAGPSTVTWNGTTYYYAVNGQGDVIGIFDVNGDCVVTYNWDNAWGYNPEPDGPMADTLGTLNPLRYRSYVYDEETGYYYLQSRYYDPEICRFINADTINNLAADDTLTGFNLFTYCCNNPAGRFDANGNWSLPNWAKIAVGVTVIVAAAAVTVATGGAAAGTIAAAVNCAAHGAFVGAVTQGAIGAATGAASGAISHRITTGSWDGAGQAAIDGAATGFMTGTITGAVTGAATSNYCFIAGTTILTATGSVAIEDICTGDYVFAWDENTGDIALKRVVETYINQTMELVHVFVNDEEIVATPAHPFYSPVRGWTSAVDLRAGDILVLVNGEYVVVEKVQHEILEAPVTVYNFQVEDYHTYYVASGVLVHNTCHGNSLSNTKTNYGYQLQDSQGNILKYGETIHPTTRYSSSWLSKNGYSMKIMTSGSKQSVHVWQHQKILDYTYVSGHRPLLNKSFW